MIELSFAGMGTYIQKIMLASVVSTPTPVQGVIFSMWCISLHHLDLFVSHLMPLWMELRIVSYKLTKTFVLDQFFSIMVRTDATLASFHVFSFIDYCWNLIQVFLVTRIMTNERWSKLCALEIIF